ncbi:MAG TPA: tetratricopeptide repeat protein [Terriglobales bacterium]|jgi:Tfp pilus assembly protein PilF|nr:tetratricopeptide repeat protein [Terriglobales bacterium]
MDCTEHQPSLAAGSDIFHAPQKRRFVFCLLLALATLALYNPVTRAPFLNYDDPVYVTNNPQVRDGLSWKTIVWTFRTPKDLDWHPMTWLSYAADSEMFGQNPEGFHTVNLLLHTVNALLLFLILESATGFAWRSLAVAVLFALHPLNVESVAWIAERKNVLSMFFFLIALAAYGWYTRRLGVGRYLAVTLAYLLALMSKAQVITFPFAVLLLDYWPLRRIEFRRASMDVAGGSLPPAMGRAPSLCRLVAEKVPWLALSVASAVIAKTTGGQAFSYTLELNAPASFPLWVRLATAAIGYAKYLGKTFWPQNLALVYPHPGYATSIPAAIVSAVFIISITALVVIFRQRRSLFVGWFWFLGTLVPMSGIVTIGPHFMADRYAYIPLLGIFVILVWGAADLIERWHIPLGMTATAAALIFLALGTALHRQVSFWSDNATLWTHTLDLTGKNFNAEENLALALIDQGRVPEALPHLQRARSLRPDDPLATANLATYDQMHGNYQAALEGYAEVVRFPNSAPSLRATAYANSGYAHLSLQRYENARQDFANAIRMQPANSSAYRGLGLLAQRAGDLAEAAKAYQRSVELQPSSVGYLLLAQALELGHKDDAARAAVSRAASMAQDFNDDLAVMKQLLAN